jgi:hypothetical protein
VLGEGVGFYSLLLVRFNKSWWLAEVYYLDTFLKPYDFDEFPCTLRIFDSLILLYFIHCSLVHDMGRSSQGVTSCPMPTAKVGLCRVWWPFGHF